MQREACHAFFRRLGNDRTDRPIECGVAEPGKFPRVDLLDQVVRVKAGQFGPSSGGRVIGIGRGSSLQRRDAQSGHGRHSADSPEKFAPPGNMAASLSLA
jgi:hypothetical protein